MIRTRVPAEARRDRVTRTYVTIRDRIVHGALAPGARIVESEVMQRVGVSRTTVRAAMQRLQQEGFVTGTTAGGRARTMVTPITSADVIELFEIVSALEGLAAEQAARLADEPRALLVALLTDLNNEYGRLASLGDDEDLLYDLDTRFHATYVEAGAGPRIQAMHDAVKPQAERYIRFHQTVLREQIETSVVEHTEIVARIEAADPAGSFEAVRTNWQNAAARLSRAISQRGERGDDW
ncbi:MAG: GntR family transcriptional regulator [Gemmatimonadales bacterium]